MLTTLHRLNESTYIDQYGFEHDCYKVIETVLVKRSDQYYEYDYYTEKVKNWYWYGPDGRKWMCHTQTDFGGSSSWSRRTGINDERVKGEKWIRDDRKEDKKDLPHFHGLKPVVFEVNNA